MLREPSDRAPEPPRWQTVIMWAFCGFVGMLLVIGVVQGVGLLGRGHFDRLTKEDMMEDMLKAANPSDIEMAIRRMSARKPEPTSSFEKMEEQVERVRVTVEHALRNDPRSRALVDSTVSFALSQAGQPDDNPARYAYDVATIAAMTMLARVYDEDGEIAHLRREIEVYRNNASRMAKLSPVIGTRAF